MYLDIEDPRSHKIRKAILHCETAEQAANMGRKEQEGCPFLLRQDWYDIRVEIMREALLAKFTQHEGLKQQLISTQQRPIVENAPSDDFWGCGLDGKGENHLGKLLMAIRGELQSRNSKFVQECTKNLSV